MAVTAIPRTIVKLGLEGIRLPLTVAQRVGERSGLDVGALPPVAVYDTVEAQAKQVLGRILRDEQLVSEGERQGAAARQRSGAQQLSDAAQEIRRTADERLDRRIERAEESREEIERRTAERLAQVEREEEEAREKAREQARKREAAARQAARTRQKAVEAKERQAELARVRAEAEALEKQAQAVEAEKVVTAIDEHLEARKNDRRGSEATNRSKP